MILRRMRPGREAQCESPRAATPARGAAHSAGKGKAKKAAALLLLPALLLTLTGCGSAPGAAPSSEPAGNVTGEPLRAIFPLEEIKMSFPGGSGTVTFRYEKETRTAVRETALQENTTIPLITPATYRTVETYHFTGDGLPETYSLVEMPEGAGNRDDPDDPNGEKNSPEGGSDGSAETASGESGDTGENAESSEAGEAGKMLLFRRFLYENGRLSALLEETPGEASGENGGASEQGSDGASEKNGTNPAAGEQDGAETEAEAGTGTKEKRIYKRLFRGAGAGTGASTGASAGYISGAALYATEISSFETVDENFLPPGQDALIRRESYVIGAGGLPMEISRPGEDEKIFFTYTLEGRSIVKRTIKYEYHSYSLWNAEYSYDYDEKGRVSRIEWTIRYNPLDEDSNWSSGTGYPALPEGCLLPNEGSYSMTLRYAEGVPSYFAAVCEELRLGSLEQGYSADLFLPLLSPSVKTALRKAGDGTSPEGE